MDSYSSTSLLRKQFPLENSVRAMGGVPSGKYAKHVERYLSGITGRKLEKASSGVILREVNVLEPRIPAARLRAAREDARPDTAQLADGHVSVPSTRFVGFGGQYVSESLMDCLVELDQGFEPTRQDPTFWEGFRSHYDYMGRPSYLYFAKH
ncbi:hypothetical protein AWENTII_007293 [Aspergillus wentii]